MTEKKSEESVPVEEVKMPKMVSVAHFINSVLVLLISFVCILIGVSIYQVYRPLDKFHPVQPETNKKTEQSIQLPLISVRPVVPKKEEVVLPKIEEKTPVIPEGITPVTPDETTPNTELEPVSAPVETNIVPEKEIELQEKTDEVPVIETKQNNALTLTEVLTLRDQLAMGKDCSISFQNLMKQDMPSESKEKLMFELMPICSHHSLFSELKSTFGQNKKDALYTYYRSKNPRWLAYTKSILTRLVDIRRLNPQNAKPKDLIYQAQNALMAHDLEKSVQTIYQLPVNIQVDFNDYLHLAGLYITAQKSVDGLLLSFDKKGE